MVGRTAEAENVTGNAAGDVGPGGEINGGRNRPVGGAILVPKEVDIGGAA